MFNEGELYKIELIVRAIIRSFNIPGYEQEDLYHEGIIEALKAVKSYDESYDTKLTTYIYTKVERKFIGLYRATQTQKRKPQKITTYESTLIEETGAIYGGEAYTRPTQEQELEEKEIRKSFIKNAKDVLNKKEIILLKLYLKGYSNGEMAKKLNLTERQISNKVYYIKKKLEKNKYKFEKTKKML